MTEKQLQNIKKRIKSFKLKLSSEKRRFGQYRDSNGLRYEIALLYIKIKDYKNAKKYFQWFEKEFSDDIGFPEFHLAWAVTMFENNDIETTKKKVYAAAFANAQIIELIPKDNLSQIIQIDTFDKDFKESIEFCANIVTPKFKYWIGKFTETEEYKNNVKKYISINKLIEDEPVGKTRSMMIDEERKFVNSLTH